MAMQARAYTLPAMQAERRRARLLLLAVCRHALPFWRHIPFVCLQLEVAHVLLGVPDRCHVSRILVAVVGLGLQKGGPLGGAASARRLARLVLAWLAFPLLLLPHISDTLCIC
jgi:hypothetical protein